MQVLCASCSAQALCACALCKLVCASCSAPVAPCKRMCSVQAALRKCSEQVALRKCSAPVAPCKRFAHVLCASWSVQVALRKCFVQLLCASCSAQVALRKLLCASDSAQVALRKCCRSCGNVLRVLFLYLKVAIFQPELRGCAPRTTFVLELREHAPHTTSVLTSCDFTSRSCRSTLRVLRLYLKDAIFKPELPRTRGESSPRPRDCESRRANHETTSKGRFASKKIARRHNESASTRTVSAEGSPRLRQIRTAPQRERFDVHDLRRGSRADRRNR